MQVKFLIYIIFIVLNLFSSTAQSELFGKWQGVIIRAGQSIDKATLLYLEIEGQRESIQGTSREEVFETENFAVKKVSGRNNDENLSIKQIVVEKSQKSSKTKWCLLSAKLKYNKSTGYLEGDYESTDCKRVIGKIILYKSDFILSKDEVPGTSQVWYERFLVDYNNGLNAPEIRKIERDNFAFEPILFDYDKATIREDHFDFLNRLIKVVKGHSDLRIKVTGHTDSDGSDYYNDELSKRRAEAIVDYFVRHGIKADRLEFEFKGEKLPLDSNSTSEGKQRNRRVDFKFI